MACEGGGGVGGRECVELGGEDVGVGRYDRQYIGIILTLELD